jgi:CubicO group peptidase (beta-lactamase class C family)
VLDDLVDGQAEVRSGVLLVEGPGFRWSGASGVAVAATGSPMQVGDQFVIDSIAKTMTATLVLQLVEEGRLGLDDPIHEYLPPSIMQGLHVLDGRSYSDQITVRHLMGHTSGIPDDWAQPEFFALVESDLDRRWTPQETVDYVKQHCTPSHPPGAGFTYSDVGYNLLGLILERVTGKPLHRVYREQLLDPLGMEHTYRPAWEDARPSLPGRPPSERYLDDLECTTPPAVMTADWGGGGMVSTVDDLDRFMRAFVSGEVFVRPETRYRMLDWVETGPFTAYGLGVSLADLGRSADPTFAGLTGAWGHSGSSGNFMYYWPERDLVLVGTLNQIDCPLTVYEILARVMRTVLETGTG